MTTCSENSAGAISLVSQPLAGTRPRIREEPGSLEGEVPGVTGTDQSLPYRGAGSATVA